MILCGGKGERLYPLTRDRAKPSVPFLGNYRIIDFSLSNSLNSGLRKIALLTQYKSLSLERHILTGWHIFSPESGEYIMSLPAQGRIGDHWYEGTADAVFQNIYTIQEVNPDLVLILSGDHVYKADYRRMIAYLIENEADAVVLTKLVPVSEAGRFGVVSIDEKKRLTAFNEKPKKAQPVPWDEKHCLASMGIYLFKTSVLIKALMKDARKASSSHDFGKDVFPSLFSQFRIFGQEFDDYWQDIGTIDAYWEANLDFLNSPPPIDLADPGWLFRTHKLQYPPSRIDGAEIRRSVIGDGCDIGRARIEDSILSPGITVEDGAEVTGSVIFTGTVVKKGSRLNRVIVDKHCIIPAGFDIGYDRDKDMSHFKLSRSGIRIVPKGWRLT